MTNGLNTYELSVDDVRGVKEQVAAKLLQCKKHQDIIGREIFSILGRYARIIYYPLGLHAPWGVIRMGNNNNADKSERPFVAINTSISLSCQVFAAAHELYHIWYGTKPDVIPSNILDDHTQDIEELKANRFAAEFLVEDDLLLQEMKISSINVSGITIKDVLILADLFTVPYRTMAKRLKEICVISSEERDKLLSESESSIKKYRKLYSIPEPVVDERITIDNLVELAVVAYEAKKITYQKLEYLLSLCAVAPEDVGITAPRENTLPSDDELDAIMEE